MQGFSEISTPQLTFYPTILNHKFNRNTNMSITEEYQTGLMYRCCMKIDLQAQQLNSAFMHEVISSSYSLEACIRHRHLARLYFNSRSTLLSSALRAI
jgi:hypothetical protein